MTQDNFGSPVGWATVIVRHKGRLLWEEPGCWGTAAAVLPDQKMVVHVGTMYQTYLFGRKYDGTRVWQSSVCDGAYGASSLLAGGRFVLASGRGPMGRVASEKAGDAELWSALVDGATGKVLWQKTTAELGMPIYMDDRTFLTIRKDFAHHHMRATRCLLERRSLPYGHPIYQTVFPRALYEQNLSVFAKGEGIQVHASWRSPTRAAPERVKPFDRLVPGRYLNNTTTYPESDIPLRTIEV